MTEPTEHELGRTDGLTVVETVTGNHFYHLRIAGQDRALCGKAAVMPTEIPVDGWGMVTHLREVYCSDCERATR